MGGLLKMEYEAAVKAPLRLKGTANKEIQKKKKKNKNKTPVDADSKSKEASSSQTTKQTVVKPKAQLKFDQMKEEQLKKRIMEKASKTHKQRVEEFNRHLDSLTEHFDIPKVSWTQ